MPDLKPPFRLTQGQRHLVLLVLAFVCAFFAVWSVLHGEMSLLQRLHSNPMTRVPDVHVHFRGVSLWIMGGAILLIAACLAAYVVAERRTLPGQKANQSFALTLGKTGIFIAGLMMFLSSLGIA